MTTLQKLIEKITAEIDFEYRAVQSHAALYRALQRFTGRTINKRLLGYYKEIAPFAVKSVEFDFIAGLHHLVVVDALGNRFRHFIGYSRDWSECDPETLALRDSCYGEAAIRRNEERSALLGSGTLKALAKAIDKHNECFQVIESLTGSPISLGHQARHIAARMLEGTEDYIRAKRENKQ